MISDLEWMEKMRITIIRNEIYYYETLHAFMITGGKHADDKDVIRIKYMMYYKSKDDTDKWYMVSEMFDLNKTDIIEEIANKITDKEEEITCDIVGMLKLECLYDEKQDNAIKSAVAVVNGYVKEFKGEYGYDVNVIKKLCPWMTEDVRNYYPFDKCKELYFDNPLLTPYYNYVCNEEAWLEKIISMIPESSLVRVGLFVQNLFLNTDMELAKIGSYYIVECQKMLEKIYEVEQIQEMLRVKEKEAENDDVKAMSYLAEVYHAGEICKKNPEKAFYYYQKAVLNGMDEDIYALAQCYAFGEGTRVDGNKAIELYEKAAIKGDYEAMRIVAYSYIGKDPKSVAIGCSKISRENDFSKAKFWFRKGVDECEKINGNMAEYCYYVATNIESGLFDDELKMISENCYIKSAGLGNVESMKHLPYLNKYVENFNNNFFVRYKKWGDEALEKSGLIMLRQLLDDYLNDDIIKVCKIKPRPKFKTEIRWLSDAVKNGDSWAAYTLGIVYYYGYSRYCATYRQMDKLYSMAAKSNNKIYAVEWGDLYFYGHIDGEINLEKAMNIYTQAAFNGDIRGLNRLKCV